MPDWHISINLAWVVIPLVVLLALAGVPIQWDLARTWGARRYAAHVIAAMNCGIVGAMVGALLVGTKDTTAHVVILLVALPIAVMATRHAHPQES